MTIKTKEAIKTLIKKIKADEIPILAGALSYFSVFAVIPVLVILLSIASNILENNLVRNKIFQYFRENISSETALVFEKIVDQLMDKDLNAIVSIISFIVLFYAGVKTFNYLQHMFNKILIPEKETSKLKKFFSKYFYSALFYFIFVIFILFIVSASIFFPSLQYFFKGHFLGGEMGQVVSFLSSFVVSVLFFCILYRVLARKETQYRAIISGAVFAGILFNIINILVSNYLSRGILSVYGIIGSIIVFLAWVYLFSFTLLLGAEIIGIVDQKDNS